LHCHHQDVPSDVVISSTLLILDPWWMMSGEWSLYYSKYFLFLLLYSEEGEAMDRYSRMKVANIIMTAKILSSVLLTWIDVIINNTICILCCIVIFWCPYTYSYIACCCCYLELCCCRLHSPPPLFFPPTNKGEITAVRVRDSLWVD
jgi:hypothetical protein